VIEKSFELIFREHSRMITAYLYSLLGDWEGAADLAQDTFVVAYRKMDAFDPERSVAAWLRGIARNLARNVIRKRYRHREFLVESDSIEAMYSALEEPPLSEGWEDRLCALAQCMEKLPDKQRQAVGLHYEERKAAKLVAKAMGILERSVFQLLWHARNNLRDCITNMLKRGAVAS
jgi:RNA polymerase sigma-70 factor (ECF subfamily)